MEEHLQRLQKQLDLKEKGVPSYPNDFRPTHTAGDLIAQFGATKTEDLEHVETIFHVAGRLIALRSFGKARFGHILNRLEKIQIYMKKDAMGDEAFEIAHFLDVGDWVGVEGRIFRTRTGELTIAASRLRILSKCVRPLPEKWHGLTDVETRFRQRYVDLIVNPDARRIVLARQQIVNGVRAFLTSRGFVEVDTPMMQPMAGGAAARPFVTHHNALDMKLFMRIAPELYLKRLLVGGIERVFEIGRNFRNEGLSTQHNPEFTMLEFYQSFATYEDLIDLTQEMMSTIAREICGSFLVPYGEHQIDLTPPWKRYTMEESLVAVAGLERSIVRDASALRRLAEAGGIKPEEGDLKSLGLGGLQMVLFEERVEPKLIQPTFITQYPVEVSPLARRNANQPELVDRFELFIAGREMANAFSELNDPADQRKRFEEQLAHKKGEEQECMAVDEDYVQALEFGMPPAAGEGIGIDRLVMLLTNSSSIREVILFPLMRSIKGIQE